jgi:hypothetical protein
MIKLAGGGGSGLIQTNSTLTGNGTLGSPLGVAGMPLPYFASSWAQTGETLSGANAIDASGFVLPYPLTFSNIAVSIDTADAVNNYDIGIYTKAGALVANIGGQPLPSTGTQSFATLQGPLTILPGMYAFAWAGAATTAIIRTSNGWPFPWFQSHNIGTAVAGTLPASVPAIAVAVAQFSLAFALF